MIHSQICDSRVFSVHSFFMRRVDKFKCLEAKCREKPCRFEPGLFQGFSRHLASGHLNLSALLMSYYVVPRPTLPNFIHFSVAFSDGSCMCSRCMWNCAWWTDTEQRCLEKKRERVGGGGGGGGDGRSREIARLLRRNIISRYREVVVIGPCTHRLRAFVGFRKEKV